MSWPVLTLPVLTWPGLTWYILTWPVLTGSVLTWPVQTWPFLAWFLPTWPSWLNLSWHDLSWLDLSLLDLSWVDQYWLDYPWLDLSWLDLSRANKPNISFLGYIEHWFQVLHKVAGFSHLSNNAAQPASEDLQYIKLTSKLGRVAECGNKKNKSPQLDLPEGNVHGINLQIKNRRHLSFQHLSMQHMYWL